MVMLFHGPGAPLSGGFFGVDVFFVLSGFLITSLLLAEHAATGGIRLGRFWLRRLLRLVPAVVLVCVFIVVVALATGELGYLDGMPAVLLYVGNWARMDGALLEGPLTHTWSLAIEEQFYLVWPLVLLFLLRRRPLLALGSTLAAAAGSAVLRTMLWDGPESYARVYNGSDTRADGLLLGCALAFAASSGLLQRLPQRLVSFAGCLAGLFIFGAALTASDTAASTYRWGTAGVTVAAAMLLVVLAVRPDRTLVRAFSWRPLVAAGRLSYGLYLWNLPVNYFFGNAFVVLPVVVGLPLSVLTTWIFASLSRRLVEDPALRLRDRLDRSRISASPDEAPGRGDALHGETRPEGTAVRERRPGRRPPPEPSSQLVRPGVIVDSPSRPPSAPA